MTSELLSRVKSSILAVEPTAEIILYGSRARNDFHEGSDSLPLKGFGCG